LLCLLLFPFYIKSISISFACLTIFQLCLWITVDSCLPCILVSYLSMMTLWTVYCSFCDPIPTP
jgi:hypothetical protein